MKRFSNILYVADSESDCISALERAVELACNNQAKLTVVDIVNEKSISVFCGKATFPVEDFRQTVVDDHKGQLEQAVAPWRDKLAIETEVLVGIPFIETIRKVLVGGHDIVVKTAAAGTSFMRLFGSEDMHLLRKCPCPVWLLKPNPRQPFDRIVAAVDVADGYPEKELQSRHELNCQVIEMAMSLALTDSAELYIASAWEAVGENYMRGRARMPEDAVMEYVKDQRHKYTRNLNLLIEDSANKLGGESYAYIHPRRNLLKGSPRNEIPAFVEKVHADLVVLGTVARTGIPGFIVGNTAETILNHISCSVLAIKPRGFSTPVSLS